METNVRTSTCRFCGRVLPVDNFPIKPGHVRARYKECAECHALGHSCIPKEKPKRRKFSTEEERAAARKEYQRRYREKNRDKMLEANRANYWHKKGEEPPEQLQKRGPKKRITEEEKRERRRESSRRYNRIHADRIREYQRKYYHKKKEDVIARQMERQREHAEEAVRETADTSRFYCTQCHQVLPAEDFITDGKQYKLCNDCRAMTRMRKAEKARTEISKRRPKITNGTSARAKYYRQYYDEHKDEIKAKRCETEPVVLNSQKRMVDMYLKGYSVHEIASRCQATVENVIETVRDYDGNVNVRICQDCWLYPCFSGMEVISCNLAKTCQKYHRKEAAS